MKYYKQVLAMQKDLFPGNNADVASSLNNMGIALEKVGQYANGLQYKKQALAMRQALFPGNHAGVATSLNSMGIALEKAGQYAEGL